MKPSIPQNICDHTFAWWGVIPPSHCIKCGAPMNVQYPQITWMGR